MYDVIIIGAGHAGVEAALATSRMGFHSLLICGNVNKIASMPCNPSIGGPAKGILVREIDALGGEMSKAADLTALQFKMLNLSKGPAVRALRVQSDKVAYSRYMKDIIYKTNHLELLEDIVDDFIIVDDEIKGIKLESGKEIQSKKVIVATGTYLSARILRGKTTKDEGPDGEKPNYGLSKNLKRLGFNLLRLKTGTPARVKTDTIDFSKSKLELGTDLPLSFSTESDLTKLRAFKDQIPCYLTYTTDLTHQIINENLHESSMYSGLVEGVGARYCPSIEDKFVRFSDKERHQIFLEPESLELGETYIQGLSTSMPILVQEKLVRSIPGFENAKIVKYAYAIEYDAIDPLQLFSSLESKSIKGLYFAGQINGTSGYEEAAAQGLMAGINVGLALRGKEPLILKRNEAYIGVLIDDLTTKGVNDPYRMLTSRAEYRLLLRHDNADQRLIKYGYEIGLIKEKRYQKFLRKMIIINDEKNRLSQLKITPTPLVNDYLKKIGSNALKDGIYASDLMKRPEIEYYDIIKITSNQSENFDLITPEIADQITISIKYQGYIDKSIRDANRILKFESLKIPADLDYYKVHNLSNEAKEKLTKIKPLTVAQATRISGVNPSDISMLLVYLEGRRARGEK